MSRIDKIIDLLTQAQSAIINCKQAIRKGGEGEALSYFVHTLVLVTKTLDELVEHVKVDPNIVKEAERLEVAKEEAREIIKRMTKLLGG